MAAEVTIQPVDILGVDAAIIFSDILVIPEAMGLPYQMVESKGPVFEKTIQTTGDLKSIHKADVNDLKYVTDAIKLANQGLAGRVPLIGFAGAPWTLFAYMTEGGGSKTFSKAKKALYTQPDLAHKVLELTAQSTVDYLLAQVKAGAHMLQIFDSWAGILSADMYDEFSLRYIRYICDEVRKATDGKIPVTVFAKDAHFARASFKELNCNVIGLDWTMDIAESRSLIGDQKTLQGNADPCLLYADDKKIISETEKMLKAFGPQKHIANLGHGLYPDIDKLKVKLFVDVIKNFKH